MWLLSQSILIASHMSSGLIRRVDSQQMVPPRTQLRTHHAYEDFGWLQGWGRMHP